MAPKPRGLKASRKAPAPFVPPTTIPAAANSERTFPLDEDALTILDLFELRQSSINLLSATTDTSAEEAQALLRGILHGADGLLRLVPAAFISSGTLPSAENPSPSVPAPSNDLLKALGLHDPLAPAHLSYLQAFALHELSALVPSRPAVVARSSALAGTEGPKKKRKVDVHEPTSPAAWLDEALPRYAQAAAFTPPAGDATVPGLWPALVAGDYARALGSRAALALSVGQSELAQTLLNGAQAALARVAALLADETDADAAESFQYEYGSAPVAARTALAGFVKLVEGAYELGSIADRLALLKEAEAWLGGEGWKLQGEDDKADRAFAIELATVKADLALATFVLLVEDVEDKYLGDADDVEDDEAEVQALPENEDVAEARSRGERAVAALRATLRLVQALPKDKQDPAVLYAQHKKVRIT